MAAKKIIWKKPAPPPSLVVRDGSTKVKDIQAVISVASRTIVKISEELNFDGEKRLNMPKPAPPPSLVITEGCVKVKEIPAVITIKK